MASYIHITDNLLYEDESIIVLNKPAGLMVEPDRNNNPNLLQELKEYLKSSSGSADVYAQHIHRLDRPVSGIVLFAKKREVLKNLSEQFAKRKVRKFYKALTESAPDHLNGKLEHWHRKEKKKAVLYPVKIEYAEKAILDYTIQAVSQNRFLWDIELHTGKYHQIRAQLASVGCPIIGDKIYGSDLSYKPNSIALQAYKLVFFQPVTQEKIIIECKNELDIIYDSKNLLS